MANDKGLPSFKGTKSTQRGPESPTRTIRVSPTPKAHSAPKTTQRAAEAPKELLATLSNPYGLLAPLTGSKCRLGALADTYGRLNRLTTRDFPELGAK